jgi:predicted Zn-ribbon and HTH transcriptional regulator
MSGVPNLGYGLSMKLKPFTLTLHGLQCLRCGHLWVPRLAEVRICPKCKSARWDQPKPRKRKIP